MRSLIVYGNEFNMSDMEFKDRSWFFNLIYNVDLQKELTYLRRKLARKPKHDTNKNFKQIQNAKNGEEKSFI